MNEQIQPVPTAPGTPRRRLRFSLKDFVFAVTLFAMTLALWQAYSKLLPLEVEVKRLRNEVGYLAVKDPTKLHAIRVATTAPDTWRYRVWVPQGAAYYLLHEKSKIPMKGLPSQIGSGGYSTIQSGEHLIDVAISKDPDDSRRLWGTILVDGRQSSRGSMYEEKHSWISSGEVRGRLAGWNGLDNQAEVFEPHEPVVLLRYRAMDADRIVKNDKGEVVSHSSKVIEEPCEGLLLWISRNPL